MTILRLLIVIITRQLSSVKVKLFLLKKTTAFMFDKRIIKTKPAEMNVLRLKFTKKASFDRNTSDRNITPSIKDIDSLLICICYN